MIQRRSPAMAQVDVAIAGGGVAGLPLAALLARAGVAVAIIEAQPPTSVAIGGDYDLRVLAITRASAQVLKACGAWPEIERARHGCFRRMLVWDAGSPGRIRFDAAAIAEPDLGHIVEQSALRMAMEEALHRQGEVAWYRPAVLQRWSMGAERLALTLDDGRRVATRLLVGADGADSKVRTLAGITYERHDYEQIAVVCNVRTERPHEETARQRFLGTGPLAFLPLDDAHTCSIVWSTTAEHAHCLLAADEAEFCAEVSGAFEHELGRVMAAGPRAGFALSRGRALRYVQPRIALVGDAAHTIHPLAGQGANLGLLDAATLAEVVAEAVEKGGDPGALPVLRRYERWRKGENLLMQSVMDAFKYLFGSKRRPLQWLRGTGLNLTDRCVPVKNLIMRRAMGLEGDLPRYARLP
ncbi:MAG: UbiH/UbiF/VisC/COQ6 family ubiquinone biosynthesis hydroxylase [Chromatiales bacterium]